jgi:small-conductance mechanosensitive channel
MQTELSFRMQELTEAQKTLTQRGEQLAQATATLKTQDENVNVATSQVQKLTQDLNAQIARVTELFNKSMALNNELMHATAQLPDLREMNEQLAAQNAKARVLLSQHGMTLEDPIDQRPPPLDANVESVSSHGDVEIAAGTHDGIRKGHVLDIVRQGRLVGSIQITDVEDDRAVGRTLRDYSVEQIRRGDIATTKLNRLFR